MKRLIVLLAIIAAVWACKQKGTEPVSMSVSEDGNVTEQPSVKPEQKTFTIDPKGEAASYEGFSFSNEAGKTISIVGVNGKTCLVFADGNNPVELVKPTYPNQTSYPDKNSLFNYKTDNGLGYALFAIDETITIGTNHGNSDAYRLIK